MDLLPPEVGQEETLRPGAEFGRIVLRSKLATGDSSDIWLCRDKSQNTELALKIFHLSQAKNTIEPRLASVAHPNVIAIQGDFSIAGRPALLMDYVDGIDLAALVRHRFRAQSSRERSFQISIVLALALDVFEGLRAAEKFGVHHHALCPSNILIGIDGITRLLGFRRPEQAGRGKLGYVSPERVRGEPVTKSDDVYAVGIILWELCAGQRLFPDRGVEYARRVPVRALHTGDLGPPPTPDLVTMNENVPREFAALVNRLLTHDPAERLTDYNEVIHQLTAIIQDVGESEDDVRYHCQAWIRAQLHRSQPTPVSNTMDVIRPEITAADLITEEPSERWNWWIVLGVGLLVTALGVGYFVYLDLL